MNIMSKSQVSRMLLQRRTEYTIFIQELGNPFLEGGGNLMAIHIWDIMDDTVVKTVRNVTKNWWETVEFVCQWATRREKQACYTTTQEE